MASRIRATQISANGSNRDDMRRDAKNLMNRLKSIQADAAFVNEIADLYPHFPVFANERCGTWYVHPSKIQRPGVYFKSTDGHTGSWDFNLRRYNPHLISAIINHGGCIVVDSTRKGKRVPDALSKTIPIWCATINNAVHECALQRQAKLKQQKVTLAPVQKDAGSVAAAVTANESVNTFENGSESSLLVPSLDSERWDMRYHSLPSQISRSEHAQIADKISGFAQKLLRFTDLTPLTMRLLKPIRPIWFTPQSFFLRDDMPDYSEVAFFPVICLSASRVVPDGMEECDGYLYVQGSGDDEEMWSKGLTPDLFWENEGYLLEDGITAAECEERAREVVLEAKKISLGRSHHHQLHEAAAQGGKESGQEYGKPGQMLVTPSMELCSEITPSPLWIGNNASARIPDCWQGGFDMVINCAAEIKRDPLFEDVKGSQMVTLLGGTGIGGAQASLCIIQEHQLAAISRASEESKTKLPDRVEGGKEYYYLHLPIAEGKKGQHQLLEMIPVAVRTMESFYASRLDAKDDMRRASTKILVHCQQGMDRSVGITLALLMSCFDEQTGEYCGANANQQRVATKEAIQRRLFQIMSHRLAARPSRATLKMINTFFMSPSEPPPAKYKQQTL
ncbi:tRNA A64-2'-O-ribosylphosphate transferase [Dissophora ornata]|nr:tRNA A64-2'-O-ribosylphosphate transferase [Dissophora ornata]